MHFFSGLSLTFLSLFYKIKDDEDLVCFLPLFLLLRQVFSDCRWRCLSKRKVLNLKPNPAKPTASQIFYLGVEQWHCVVYVER